MKIQELAMQGLFLIEPDVYEDDRGFLMVVHREDFFKDQGIPVYFVQENQSRSKKDVLRGLHFQWDPPLGKLIRVTQGITFMVAVDIRKTSRTFGQWLGMEIGATNKKELYASPGFATGFCSLADSTDVQYRYTALYNPAGEGTILWNDSRVGIKWPLEKAIISERDKKALTLAEWSTRKESDLFV